MGAKALSKEEELELVEDYRKGASVSSLMEKYNFKTKKSITDKVKKYYPDIYKEIIEEARYNRKGYKYTLDKISNEFDAYYIGLMLTDGYIDNNQTIGIDLVDEDCIAFLSKVIGKSYSTYEASKKPQNYNGQIIQSKQKRHRLVLKDKKLIENLERFGVVPRKTHTIQGPKLLPEEEKFIPYIIRGIIDGDGCVTPASYGGAQFSILTASYDFALWIKETLENKMYMKDIHIHEKYGEEKIYEITSTLQSNIIKLIALSYDKPFGMSRKYDKIRKTFRDYNGNSLVTKDEGIVQTTTEMVSES